MVGYIIITIARGVNRLNLLGKDCDPDAFLEATIKQKQIVGKNPKLTTYLEIDEAVAFMEKGNFLKAKDILLAVDKKYLSVKNGTSFIYTIDLIACLYELGEFEEAEEMFENEIQLSTPMNKMKTLSMEVLSAERLYFSGNYDESKNKRMKLSIVYRLAQIDETLQSSKLIDDKIKLINIKYSIE